MLTVTASTLAEQTAPKPLHALLRRALHIIMK
jgi:hypothetical protein